MTQWNSIMGEGCNLAIDCCHCDIIECGGRPSERMSNPLSPEKTKELLRQIEKDTTVYFTCRGCGTTTNAKVGSDRRSKRLCVTCYITDPSYKSAPQSNENKETKGDKQ